MIAVMIGFTPADIATGIAMTGTIARDGMAPGPTAQIRNPSRYMTNGISVLCGPTSATIFFARSSRVPFSLMMANRYVMPIICIQREELNPLMMSPALIP